MTTSQADLLPEAYAVALSALPGIGPARLRRLLQDHDAPSAWARMKSCTTDLERPCAPSEAAATWSGAARAFDVTACWDRHREAGIGVHVRGGPGYPEALAGDREAPAVLFSSGALRALEQPLVAVVGTRSATHYGEDVAAELGAGLAASGVGVLSGLALGIDGAAHEGALSAGGAAPVAVVGTGLDVVYPRRHASLWRRVAEAGTVVSEWPLGTRPDGWRFPLRNRIIAALAQVLVVVETHEVGGALHTVDAALARDVPVMAVPGSVRSRASAGCNALLADGASPVRDVDDVLCALGLGGAGQLRLPASPADQVGGPTYAGIDELVLRAVGGEAVSTGDVLDRTGLTLEEVAMALERLSASGLLRPAGGWWVPTSDRARLASRREARRAGAEAPDRR